jgi:pimeloyl-ACP methyl ester carboxylesterase
VPGLFHSWELLAPQQDEFTKMGYNTVAISLRKHGNSTTPQEWNEISLDDYTQDVAVVIEQIGLSEWTFWAHSAGSLVVRNYALKYGTAGVQAVWHAAPAPMSPARFNMLFGYYLAAWPAEMNCLLTTFNMACIKDVLEETFVNNLPPEVWKEQWSPLLSENESIDMQVGAQALLGLDTFGAVPEVIIAPIADRTIPFAGVYDDAAVIGATVQEVGCGVGHDYWLDLSVCNDTFSIR